MSSALSDLIRGRARSQAERRIRFWLDAVRERDAALYADVLTRCASDPEYAAYFLSRAPRKTMEVR